MTKTTNSGAESQADLSGAMTPVVYTADNGYYFPENYSVAAVYGISVTRNSSTQITVSGTPTANAEITLTAPTAKTTPAAPTTAAATDCTTADNNDGKLTGVTTAMEYKKSDAENWTDGTGSDITGLVPGTYYVRIKATDTTLASDNQELTINAAQTQTETLLTTITATGTEQASYSTANVATVSFSYTAGGSSAYLANWGWWGYGWIATVTPVEGYTITKCVFYDDANRKATDSKTPFVVETTEEDKTPRINGTPIDGGNMQSKGITKIEVYGYTASAHDHSFTYSADGATITAACTTGCDITEGLTMTISAPTALTYDGTAKEASLSTGYNTTAFPDTYTISYYQGETALTSAPVNAGTYIAKVTAGTGTGAATAQVQFTIAPKTVSAPTITLSPESYTYDGNAKQPTVTVKDGTTTIPESEYTVSYSANTNAGTAKVTITDNAGGNYVVSGEKTFTIEKGSQSAPSVSSTNETIDGKADGTITGVTTAMEYKSAAANEYTAVTGTTIANLPAGTYNVRYKETHNYNASPAADVVINTGSKLTVQFDADGGSPAPSAQQLSYSQTVSAPAADPEKTGYTFLYWSADGEAEYDFSAPLTANITLKAVYQANQYTITFDTDGGSDVAAITQDYGTAVTAPADPTKTGYTFAGWDKEIPATMPAESMTITAQWTINRYTMTFDDNGSHSEYVLDYGTNLTDYIPDIQWEGHTFMGWNPEVPETVPAEDMTFTAVWDTNTYTITFDSNGGSYVAPIVQDFGTKVIAPMNPVREGFAFIGWDKEIPAEMPAYDMTVRAQWVKAAGTGAARISSGTARVPSGTAHPEVTVSSTDEITPKMWAVLNDDNSVTVSWEKIKNADSYILYVEKNGKAVKLTETKGTEVTLKNAKNGVTYKFSLKYTRNGSTFSAPKGYKANLRVYYKPAVKVAVTKDGKILLKWNKVANADKYVIYRVNTDGKLVKAGTTTKTAARIAAKSTDTGYVVRASVNGKMTPVTKSDIVTAE